MAERQEQAGKRAYTSSCKLKRSARSSSKRSAQRCAPVSASTNWALTVAAALEEGWRALKAFEKEQEPVITAGLAARKASREAYAAAVKAWEMRMELERATSEKTRPEH